MLLVFRNCLLGKAYHIKICDFGSDCPEFRRDYTEMEDGLLVPVRWMAWESVIEVIRSQTGSVPVM
jgi:discoidin domain receptor family protein 2